MNKKIKVLMCGSKLSVGGGMVTVIKNYLDYQNWENVKITYIPTHIEKSALIKGLYFLIAYIRIWFKTTYCRYDVAHLHTTENGSFYRKAYIMKLLQKRKVKVILHHHIDYTNFYETQTKKKFIKTVFLKADMNIVLGKKLGEFIRQLVPEAKVKVVYNAVNICENNCYNPEATYILFLGWLIERKGITDFLTAIQKLNQKLDDKIKVILCGKETQEVKAKIKKLGIQNRVAHIGWVTAEQKKLFFNNSFVNVLPSYREGLPMTILESMAYGIPSISTNIAAIPEVIQNNYNGFLVNPGDVDGLAEAILHLYKDKDLRKKFSQNAYMTISEKFSIARHMENIEGIYRSLLE